MVGPGWRYSHVLQSKQLQHVLIPGVLVPRGQNTINLIHPHIFLQVLLMPPINLHKNITNTASKPGTYSHKITNTASKACTCSHNITHILLQVLLMPLINLNKTISHKILHILPEITINLINNIATKMSLNAGDPARKCSLYTLVSNPNSLWT